MAVGDAGGGTVDETGRGAGIEVQVVYWRDLPSMVTARRGRRERASAPLSARFQVAIDEAAMRGGLTGTDAYLEQWRRSAWQPAPGAPDLDAAAQAAAAALEAEYPPARVRGLVAAAGRAGEADHD